MVGRRSTQLEPCLPYKLSPNEATGGSSAIEELHEVPEIVDLVHHLGILLDNVGECFRIA